MDPTTNRKEFVQKIERYILENPSMSFNQIYEYGMALAASDGEIREAVAAMGKILSKKEESKKNMFKDNKKYLRYVPLVVFVFWILYFSGLGTLFVLNSQNKKLLTKGATPASPSTSVNQIAQSPDNLIPNNVPDVFQANPVYANQIEVNAQQTFSYPAAPVTLHYTGTPKKEVMGFFPYWMLPVSDKIDIDAYTSVSLFGLTLNGNGDIVTKHDGLVDGGWAMWKSTTLDQFTKRLKSKRLKIFITIKSFDNSDIEKLVSSDDSQKRAIANIIEIVNERSLSGVNIDFEYVGTATSETKKDFTRFIANLRSELKKQVQGSELSVDTYLSSGSDTGFFDVQLLEPLVDSIVVMGYDVHTLKTAAGPVAPFEGSSGIVGYMQSYLDRIPANKIILALPYYGYDWVRNSDKSFGYSILPYATIASQNLSPVYQWDLVSSTPFITYRQAGSSASHIIYFDNSRSLGIKYDYINNKNLKGLGVWAMGYEGNYNELSALVLQKFAQ